MVRSGSLFSQLLEQIPRSAFAKLVNRHGAEYCAKGGVKAHVLLDHDHYMPSYVLISKAKLHDSKLLARLRLNPGSIIAMDRAYNDYAQFGQWTEQGVYFVTRMKDNARYEVVEERTPPKNRNVLRDETIRLTGVHAKVPAHAAAVLTGRG